MYETFFRLNSRPFAATPNAAQCFASRTIEAARRTLARCIERAEGIGVLIGAAGTGKTLVCQLLRRQFADQFAVAALGSTRLDSPRAVLQAIVFELGLPWRGLSDGDLRLNLVDFLADVGASRQGLLLIADEAHTLPGRVLEELRLITNVALAAVPRVRLILAGSPLLEERLANPRLASIAQRSAARSYLEPLDRAETAAYVQAQLDWAGAAARRIFTETALDGVYSATDGVPRLINQVCDHALVLAAAQRTAQIGADEIQAAWADLQQLPTPWNHTAPAVEVASDVIQFGQFEDEDEGLADIGSTGSVSAPVSASCPPAPHAFEVKRPAAKVARAVTATRLQVAQSSDPFAEAFDEEEIIVDRFGTMHAAVWDLMPHVYSAEGRNLANLLAPYVQTSKPLQVAVTESWHESSDDGMIVVEDDPPIIMTVVDAKPTAYRQEYSELFAKLRNS